MPEAAPAMSPLSKQSAESFNPKIVLHYDRPLEMIIIPLCRSQLLCIITSAPLTEKRVPYRTKDFLLQRPPSLWRIAAPMSMRQIRPKDCISFLWGWPRHDHVLQFWNRAQHHEILLHRTSCRLRSARLRKFAFEDEKEENRRGLGCHYTGPTVWMTLPT